MTDFNEPRKGMVEQITKYPKNGNLFESDANGKDPNKRHVCIHSSIPKAAENLMEPFERTTSVAFGVNSFYL